MRCKDDFRLKFTNYLFLFNTKHIKYDIINSILTLGGKLMKLNPLVFLSKLKTKALEKPKIKDFKIIKYERILELYFDYFD